MPTLLEAIEIAKSATLRVDFIRQESEIFLTEPLPVDWEDWEREEVLDFIEVNVWLPYGGEEPAEVFELIEMQADVALAFAQENTEVVVNLLFGGSDVT